MSERPAPFDLAERVAAAAAALDIQTAVIGAGALALHRLVRATQDVDLASFVDPRAKLRPLEDELRAQGLLTELRMPDGDDPLGGVLRVWSTVDDEDVPVDLVEIVNFDNPHRPRRTPAARAIREAISLMPGSALRYVQLADLVALKLDAGGRVDLADIVEVLARNPEADLDAIRARATPFDRGGQLEILLAEASARWPAS